MTATSGRWIKETVSTPDAPAAVGPYSQGIAAGPLVFVSGQLGIVPGTKDLAGHTIEDQTRQAMENVAAILDEAGSSLERIVKMTVGLADINDFQAFNAVYSTFFSQDPPARAVYEVKGLPLGAKVEIETVALRD